MSDNTHHRAKALDTVAKYWGNFDRHRNTCAKLKTLKCDVIYVTVSSLKSHAFSLITDSNLIPCSHCCFPLLYLCNYVLESSQGDTLWCARRTGEAAERGGDTPHHRFCARAWCRDRHPQEGNWQWMGGQAAGTHRKVWVECKGTKVHQEGRRWPKCKQSGRVHVIRCMNNFFWVLFVSLKYEWAVF